jgi:pteridine reductase
MSKGVRVALVTGAAQRIGTAIATALHANGYNLVIHYNTSDRAAKGLTDTFNERRPDSAACLQADLGNMSALEKLANNALALWARMDLLVNNASAFFPTPVGDTTESQWAALMDSNLKGPYFLSQALVAALRDNGGSIINLVDIHASSALKNYPVYSMAKAGLATMTRSLAVELAPDVRVNGIAPGAILWPTEQPDDASKQQIIGKIPLGKTGEPGDIANTVLFLADSAPYITGQIIAVDGGRSLNN